MKRITSNGFMGIVLLALAALPFSGCGGVGTGSSSGGGGSSTTTISGKVSLSGTVSQSGKPSLNNMAKALYSAPKGKPGSKAFLTSMKPSTELEKLFAAAQAPSWITNSNVYLFDADHPEWLYPVAEDITDNSGNYSLASLKNAGLNGNSYKDGGDLPAGNYTLMAVKEVSGEKPIVAVQAIVKKFDGTVAGVDLVALPSNVAPRVRTMFGVKKTNDGTQRWGCPGGDAACADRSVTLATNANIQVSFSMPVKRDTLSNITVSPAVPGKWSLSADWLTATYYLSSGASLSADTEYTVTVNGADSGGGAVANVYGNAVEKTAYGYFRTNSLADDRKPTALWKSPTIVQMNSELDIVTPIRIASNEALDVNGLLLEGTGKLPPDGTAVTLGDKPGVMFVGKESDSGLYIYEFILGEPLKLDVTYDLIVSGGRDMAGNAMNDLSGSITTVSQSAGVFANATSASRIAKQGAQAEVKDVFGKWVRAMNDRNIAQLQTMMSGDFYMEYDTSKGISQEDDPNRDGRFDIVEFSNMLMENAFPQWDFCGTTITGEVVTKDVNGNDIFINPNLTGIPYTADFEFKLTGASTVNSQRCNDVAPKDSLYATLHQINGAWVIVRASEGIDTRTKSLSFPSLISARLYENTTPVADGGTFTTVPDGTTTVVNYEWDAVPGVSSYIVVLMDARNPDNGVAVALPTTLTSISKIRNTTYIESLGGKDVSSKFGLYSDTGSLFWVPGGEYYWEVIGLASTAVDQVLDKRPGELLKDISAVSKLQRFGISGTYRELLISITKPPSATPVAYSELIGGGGGGFDVGNAGQVTITVTSTDTSYSGTGSLSVSGNSYQTYTLVFISGVATATVDLYKGANWIYIDDGNPDSDWSKRLYKYFTIVTTGGIQPVLNIMAAFDDVNPSVPLFGDVWNYYSTASGSKKVTIYGSVSDTSVTEVYIYTWNELGAYNPMITASVNSGVFFATLDLYKGNNWISLNASGGAPNYPYYYSYMGVYTDTGMTWVPPISVTEVTNATKTGEYPYSSDWDASSPYITIKGKFKNPADGSFYVWSEAMNTSGTVYSSQDGSFSIPLTIYNGWTYVSINDSNYNWYGVNIYTENGKVFIKPTITTIDGAAYTEPSYGGQGSALITDCAATINGTAQTGNVYVYVNSYDGTSYSWDNQTVQSVGTTGQAGNFTVTVPVVSGTGYYNNIDIYDKEWKWTGVNVTTTGSCAYVSPEMTVDLLKDATDATLASNLYATNPYIYNGGPYDAGTSSTITLSGTSNQPGRTITVSVWTCSKEEKYSTSADSSGNWSISGIKVYDTTDMSYWYNVSDGYNGFGFWITSVNGVNPTPPLDVTSLTGGTKTNSGCGYSEWTGVTSTTVTISGTTTAQDGIGTYSDPLGGVYTFNIAGGTFTISNVSVYDGYNYININDTNWNYHSVSISATNGVSRPKPLAITSPLHNASPPAGPLTVIGTFDTGFSPTYVYGYTESYNSGTSSWEYNYFSTDLYEQQTYGYGPLTVSGSNFSFDANIGDTSNYTYIYVYAYDSGTATNHAHSIYVNNVYSYGDWWYKPTKKTSIPVNEVADRVKSLKTARRLMSRHSGR